MKRSDGLESSENTYAGVGTLRDDCRIDVTTAHDGQR